MKSQSLFHYVSFVSRILVIGQKKSVKGDTSYFFVCLLILSYLGQVTWNSSKMTLFPIFFLSLKNTGIFCLQESFILFKLCASWLNGIIYQIWYHVIIGRVLYLQNLGSADCLGDAEDFKVFPGKGVTCRIVNIKTEYEEEHSKGTYSSICCRR